MDTMANQQMPIDSRIYVVGFILLVVILIIACIFIGRLIVSNSIKKLRFKDLELDFTDVNQVRQNGESNSIERFRILLLKQLLFTQEFVNRFQPLISTFVTTCKHWDERSKSEDNQETQYPSLRYIDESLNRFRDLTRNTHFNYVINWECPIYDTVDSGYRRSYISNIGYKSNLNNTFIPNLIDDCNKNLSSIDMDSGEIKVVLKDLNGRVDANLTNVENIITNYSLNDFDENFDGDENNTVELVKTPREIELFDQLETSIRDLQTYVGELHENQKTMSSRYDYAMDIANSMYESLLYWNEKTPRILQSETSSLLYVIYQNLSMWLIRNDLPLSPMKLEQYLDTHTENLVARINEEIVKQMPRFNKKMWEESLIQMKISDIDVNNYFRSSLKDWINGVQQVRFGVDIFLGMEDYATKTTTDK